MKSMLTLQPADTHVLTQQDPGHQSSLPQQPRGEQLPYEAVSVPSNRRKPLVAISTDFSPTKSKCTRTYHTPSQPNLGGMDMPGV